MTSCARVSCGPGRARGELGRVGEARSALDRGSRCGRRRSSPPRPASSRCGGMRSIPGSTGPGDHSDAVLHASIRPPGGVAHVLLIPARRLKKGPQRRRLLAGGRPHEMASSDPAFRGPVRVRLGLHLPASPLARGKPAARASWVRAGDLASMRPHGRLAGLQRAGCLGLSSTYGSTLRNGLPTSKITSTGSRTFGTRPSATCRSSTLCPWPILGYS